MQAAAPVVEPQPVVEESKPVEPVVQAPVPSPKKVVEEAPKVVENPKPQAKESEQAAPEQKMISLVKEPSTQVKDLNLNTMTDEDRKKLRAERFGNNETSTAAAAARLAEEKQKTLQRAMRFNVDNDELE